MRKNRIVWGAMALTLFAAAAWSMAADKPIKSDPALERARREVKMLDDLYKTAVVLITDKYVEDGASAPAGVAAKAIFATMKKNGWHEARLVDATGKPANEDNAPSDDFEKEAIKQLKAGKPYYEQVVTQDGVRHLRAATIVPVVLEKCAICHAHYKDAKKGEAIGAIAYKLKIE